MSFFSHYNAVGTFEPEFQFLKLEILEQKQHFMLARRNPYTPGGMDLSSCGK